MVETISHFPFSSIFNVTVLEEVGVGGIGTVGLKDRLEVERFASEDIPLRSLEQLTIFLA